MKLAAFVDIGYKNLSTLILDLDQLKIYLENEEETDAGIYEWRVDDITAVKTKKCDGKLKKGGVCGKKAVWMRRKNSSEELPEYCCGTHLKQKNLYKRAPKEKRGTLVQLVDNLYKLYDSMENLQFVVSADIEKQLSKNRTATELSIAVYCWFVVRRVTDSISGKLNNLTMFSNKRKLEVWRGRKLLTPGFRDKKRVRKWLAIAYTDLYLLRDDVWHDFFSKNKKKDDLADTFLMAVWRCGRYKPLGVLDYGYEHA